ncbi:sensor histidine kinase [Terriglobus roseus]|uniref:Two component regulator propeller n=1 Tax=Terriglobus roseus TaxID=392734 RepID=A0A1H4IZR8_9BACT|nr:sensor histidine kinase [Terriglobus roseus]SEB39549.1 Two component regulator propeller [Terriglobus roseus]
MKLHQQRACYRLLIAVQWLGMLFLLATPELAVTQGTAPRLTQYAHEAWRVRDGLLADAPIALAQTTDGYLWIGTSAGLVRFDGVHFVPWKTTDAKDDKSVGVLSLQAARDGSLWFGTGTSLAQLKNGQVRVLPGLKARVNDLSEDAEGNLWLSLTRMRRPLDGPLCRTNGKDLKCFGSHDGLPCTFGNVLAHGSNGAVWMGSYPGACSWSKGTGTAYLPKGMKQGDVTTAVNGILDQGKEGVLLGFEAAGGGLGLQRVVDGRWRSFDLPGVTGSQLKVTALFSSKNGDIWVGTEDDGVYHIANGRADHFGLADGLTDNEVRRFYQDHEDNIWIGTAGGLDKFHPLPVTTMSVREGLNSNNVQTALALPRNTMAFSTRAGLSLLHDGSFTSFAPQTNAAGISGASTFVDHAGTLWVGMGTRLTIFVNGSFRRIDLPDGSAPGQVTGICEDSLHTIWIVTSAKTHRVFRVVDGVRLKEIDIGQPSPGAGIVADPVHGVWIDYSRSGLLHMDAGGQLEDIKSSDATTIERFAFDPDGSIWAWSLSGLFHLKDHRWTKLDATKGLPCSQVMSMLKDGRGSTWVYLSCGLVVLSDAELQRWSRQPASSVSLTHVFDGTDGAHMTHSPFSPHAAVGSDGRLWFAGDGLLQTVDATQLALNTVAPPVHIETVIADRVTYAATDVIHLPKLTHDLAIDYSALSLVTPQKVRFRYRLSGVDKDWQDVAQRRQAFYMNLRPGRYVFQVIACNNDGLWNMTGAHLVLVIPPAFYQTFWFYALVALVVICLLSLTLRIRIHSATRHAEARQYERLAERDRIARELHDTLIQGLQGIILNVHGVILEVTGNERPKEKMEKVLDQAERLLVEGRNRVRDLRSQTVGGVDLAEPLKQVIEDLRPVSGPEITLEVVGDTRPVQVLVRDEIVAFAREALLNAVRHSRGVSIDCVLVYERSLLSFQCSDDGIGFDEDLLASRRSEGHAGLTGMQERAAQIGATMSLSNEGKGVSVRLSVPGRVAFSQWRNASRSAGRIRRTWKRAVDLAGL